MSLTIQRWSMLFGKMWSGNMKSVKLLFYSDLTNLLEI